MRPAPTCAVISFRTFTSPFGEAYVAMTVAVRFAHGFTEWLLSRCTTTSLVRPMQVPAGGLLVGTLGALRSVGTGSINPKREARRLGRPTDPLRVFELGFVLTARWRGAGCHHARELPLPLLIKAYGPDAILEHIAAHTRCS